LASPPVPTTGKEVYFLGNLNQKVFMPGDMCLIKGDVLNENERII
jgi:hypothetical protein